MPRRELVAHGGPCLARKHACVEGLKSSNALVLQRYWRVERVTGIEPALSAWELLERRRISLARCGFGGHERPGVNLACPL